jgi:hypothetical protein
VLKLPKDVMADPRHDAIRALLERDLVPLWEGARHSVPTVPCDRTLANILRGALHSGHAAQGLELITEKLAAEQKGLDAAMKRSGEGPHSARASRLLFIANDGSERFYRDCDGLLARYPQRLLACRIDLPGDALGEALFGAPKLVRSLVVLDKKVVSRALLSLVPRAS